jgi:predicted metal-dependent phosphoesterase TrpH
MPIVDLHTHTNKSDGALSPNELIQRALDAKIEVLSITDHDTVCAFDEVEIRGVDGLQIIPGVEFSTQWRTIGIHVLGLNVDLSSESLRSGVTYQSAARQLRAEKIAQRLDSAGIPNALSGAQTIAGSSALGRPHFARFLVDCGAVKNVGQAFRKYLGAGKIGDVKQHWAPLDQIITWINDANGIAVLAHPAKYGLTRTKRIALIDDFHELGGQAIEVISGQQDPALTASLATTVNAKNMLASCGSDFHSPHQPWARLGMPLVLPRECRPVWSAWSELN